MARGQRILRCHRVWFYSQGDERAFFEFAQGIKGVKRIGGVGEEIHLHVAARLSAESLRDLLALFRRYEIELGPLRQFVTAANQKWFKAKNQYWHKAVFGRSPIRSTRRATAKGR